MKLKCPSCGVKGEIRGNEDSFEARGHWPYGHWPVRRCRTCGSGVLVMPGFPRARGTLIPHVTWSEMEREWASGHDLPDPFAEGAGA